MKVSTEIVAERNLRRHTVTGLIDVAKVAEFLQGLYASEDIGPDMDVFWNLQAADFSAVTAEDIHSLMEFVGKQWGQGGRNKAAIVVARDLDYGLSRMYQMMMEGTTSSQIAIFRDLAEAETWLQTERP